MQTMQNAAEWKDRRPVLSTLWIFLVLNYLFADVYALFFDVRFVPSKQDNTPGDDGEGDIFFTT